MTEEPKVDRRQFLNRSATVAVGGVSALWMAHQLVPRRVFAAAGSEVAASEGAHVMENAISDKTASSLLLDVIRIDGEPEPALEAYVHTQTQPLLDRGVAASASVYHMRQQNVPASALGDGIYFAVYQLVGDEPVTARSMEPVGDRWQRIALTSYGKMADYGRPDPAGDAPDSVMIVVSRPTDVGYDALFNEWYTDNHMIDVAKSPHFRSATRYRPVMQTAGAPLGYLCIYEIEHPYSPELHEGLMRWLTQTPDDFRQEMPKTPAGEGVLTLDVWGYCERVWSSVTGESSRRSK